MSFDVVVFGTLQFPKGKFAAWQKMPVDLKGTAAVDRLFPPRRSAEKGAPATSPTSKKVVVRDLIETLQSSTGYGLFSITQSKSAGVTVRGRLSHAGFEARGREVAILLLSARKALAEGDICILGEGVFVGYGISLAGGDADLIQLSHEEVQNASMAPELDVISGYFNVAPPVIPSNVKPPAEAAPRIDLLEIRDSERPR